MKTFHTNDVKFLPPDPDDKEISISNVSQYGTKVGILKIILGTIGLSGGEIITSSCCCPGDCCVSEQSILAHNACIFESVFKLIFAYIDAYSYIDGFINVMITIDDDIHEHVL